MKYHFVKLIFPLIVILISSSYVAGQKSDNNWMLQGACNPYSQLNINFTNGVLDTSSAFRQFGFFITNTSISDSLGNLLFYTNGASIANSNHNTLFNSTNFNTGYEASINCNHLATIQETLILPKPGNQNLYYIFHEVRDQFTAYGLSQESPFNLRYSVTDMNLGSGLGGIDPNKKSLILINDTMSNGMITACRHGNGRDWWVIAPRFWSNKYYKLLFSTDSVIQIASQVIGDTIKYATLGQANFSPDGNWYAIVDHVNNLNIFKFDRCSGLFYDSTYISVPNLTSTSYENTIGLSFSGNSRFLYITSLTKIYQYDLSAVNIQSTEELVAEWDSSTIPTATYFLNAQLAPDNKIYVGTFGGTYVLHCINYPDSAGLACNVIQNYINIGSNLVGNASVPTFPNFKLGRLPGSPCDTIVGINESATQTVAELFVYYTTDLQTAFINANKLQGTQYHLEVFDLMGKSIFRESGKISPPYFTKNLSCSGYAKGMYIVNLQTDKKRLVKRFVIE